MPVVATLIGAGIVGGTQIYAANKNSNAATTAANDQEAAANQAAQLQATAAANTLAFEKSQADQTQSNFIASQGANYNQWLYRQGITRPYQSTGLSAENSLAQMLGLPAINTTLPDTPPPPVFQTGDPGGPTAPPPANPHAVPQPGQGPSGAPTAASLSNPSAWMSLVSNPSSLSSWVKSVAPTLSPDLVSYYVSKIQGQPGANPTEQAGSANYWAQKILSDPTLSGGSGSASQPSPTVGSYAAGGPIGPTPAGTGVTMPFLPLS